MGQTNIQVPIEQRNHDKEVLENRKRLFGDERFKSPGPSALGPDKKLHPVVLYHNSTTEPRMRDASPAPDLLYTEHTTNAGSEVAGMPTLGMWKQHMSGRRYAGETYNVGRNVGSTHLMMEARPHRPEDEQYKEMPADLGTVLPKDQ